MYNILKEKDADGKTYYTASYWIKEGNWENWRPFIEFAPTEEEAIKKICQNRENH